MKKFLALLLLLTLVFVGFACGEDKKEDDKKQDDNQQEEVKEFTVKFVAEGNETKQTVKEGEKATKPADPVKEGYTFVGWFVGDKEYDFGAVNADVTVTAKFEKNAADEPGDEPGDEPEIKEYTVKFVVDGEATEVKVTEGEKAVKPVDPVKEGFVFLGWYVGEETYDFKKAVTSDLEVVAKFEEVIKEYTVKFVVDGEETVQVVKEGEKVTKPASPEKEGYTFEGWYAGDEAYDFEKEVTSDFELVARFKNKTNEALKPALESYVKELDGYVNCSKLASEYVYEEEVYTLSYEFAEMIDSQGNVSRLENEDKEVSGNISIEFEGSVYSETVTLNVYGTFLDELAEEFASQFSKPISGNISVKTSYTEFGGTKVVWETSNSEILDNKGRYNRPFHDEEVVVTFFLRSKTPDAKHYYKTKVLVKGEDISVKTALVKEWINDNFATDHKLYKDTVLITEVEDYNATIEWLDPNYEKVTSLEKYVQNEVLGLGYEFNLKITIFGESHTEKIYYRVWEKELTDTWEKVDLLLEAINNATVGSYTMKMTGYTTEHYGAIYFFNQDAPVVNTEYMAKYTYGYVNTGIKKTSTEYVVVHDTAGGAPTHTSLQFALDQYNKNNNDKNTTYISWHYTVGDDMIYQSLPLDEVAYHAGDGSHVYGDVYYNSSYNKSDCIGGGNRNGIGIETCVNHGSNYNETMKKLAKLIVRDMFSQFENLNLSRVKEHYHFSGKDCPYVIRHAVGWDKFLNFVAIENFGATELQGVDFEWESLSPDYLDETGNVNKKANVELAYKAKVTYNNETKEFINKFIPEEYVYDQVIKYF